MKKIMPSLLAQLILVAPLIFNMSEMNFSSANLLGWYKDECAFQAIPVMALTIILSGF